MSDKSSPSAVQLIEKTNGSVCELHLTVTYDLIGQKCSSPNQLEFAILAKCQQENFNGLELMEAPKVGNQNLADFRTETTANECSNLIFPSSFANKTASSLRGAFSKESAAKPLQIWDLFVRGVFPGGKSEYNMIMSHFSENMVMSVTQNRT